MSIQRNLTDPEWALLAIVKDPILLGEFCRNTANGSLNKDEWLKGPPFKYRWYQKDLLTDKTEYIVLTAGRAVGKCSPWEARVLVYPYGYMTIRDIMQEHRTLPVWTVDCKNRLTTRRLRIGKNGTKPVYRVTTESGFEFEGTTNHPLMTPTGYKEISELKVDDQVQVATYLPHTSQQNMFAWEELRWMGYAAGRKKVSCEMRLPVKYQRNVLELKQIAHFCDSKLERHIDGTYWLPRKIGPVKHYITLFLKSLGILRGCISDGFRRIHKDIKAERLENIKIFLESFISTYSDIDQDTFKRNKITFYHHHKTFSQDLQEILLRFGIQSRITKESDEQYRIDIEEYASIYALFEQFDLPGIIRPKMRLPERLVDPNDYAKWDDIVSIEYIGDQPTWAIYVPETHNYISDNLFVHNSLVLEDKLIYEAVNAIDEFPITREQVFTTANQNQMTPILDHLVTRITGSRLLRDFLKNQVNRSKGTLDFPVTSTSNYRLYTRIAGSKGENNVVGLHVPKIKIDEVQIYPQAAFTQLEPCYNDWEEGCSQWFCGVPNGLRDGSVLYWADMRAKNFKKYRIPAHQNPYYQRWKDIENIKKYGGEDSDDYIRLVLGRHGDAAFSIIPRDKIKTEPYEFYSYRYTQTDKHNGKHYKDQLGLNKLPADLDVRVLAIDTGYADPTVCQVIGRGKDGIWRTYARYRLTRIPFPEQADIINWLDDYYSFNSICIDLGAGGGGIGVSQDLSSERFSKHKAYSKRIHGVRFADYIDNGEDSAGNVLKTQAKSFAGQELARLITEGAMVFSEIDSEGISQMERVAYQRQSTGLNKYFIISDKREGKSNDDHIFASYIVFVLSLLNSMFEKPKKKLASAKWI